MISSITQASKELLSIIPETTAYFGKFYTLTSGINYLGYFQNYTPTGVATAFASIELTDKLLDLTTKRIKALAEANNSFEKINLSVAKFGNSRDLKQCLKFFKNIPIAHKLYCLTRCIAIVAIPYLTHNISTTLVNNALNSAVTYLPTSALAISSNLSIVPTTLVVTTIGMTGIHIQNLNWLLAQNKQKHPKAENHTTSISQIGKDLLNIFPIGFGIYYGLMSGINYLGYAQNFTPLGVTTAIASLRVSCNLLDSFRKCTGSLNWIDGYNKKLKEIKQTIKTKNEQLNAVEKGEEYNTLKLEIDKLHQQQSKITNYLKPYQSILGIISIAISCFIHNSSIALVNNMLSSAVTYLPSFALAICSYLSITPISLSIATISATGLLIALCREHVLKPRVV